MNHRIFPLIGLLLLLAYAAACSDHSRPDNPEPTIIIHEATDISRTEAIVTAAIDRHGGHALSYVTLHCNGPESTGELTIDADPSATAFEFHLTDLAPGTSYTCHLQAGTATATLKSDAITFTTIPNNPPQVSEITPLSAGPLGIMVSFSIIDDGGEPITEAGCEVKESGSSEGRRIYAAPLNPLPDHFRLSITGLTPASTYTITPFASNSQGEVRGKALEYTTSESVVLTEPGMLASLFAASDPGDLETLTIAGPMDGDDFRTLRSMLGAPGESDIRLRVSDIDLTDVSIVEGGGSYDGQRFTMPDRLSTGLLSDCAALRHALLPATAIAMERDAFARCASLEILTIPARVEALLPSAGCTALKAIEVSEANTHFSSDQGVLLNADASDILWFPCGKTGEYRFPPSISAIKEGAFAGTSITTLIIPPAVKSISRGAFAGSALTEIRLPDNIANISEGMFQNCSTLATISLGKGTEYVGDYAFDGTCLSDLFVGADFPPYASQEAFTNRMKTLADECTLHV
ncbi:MAG: leucine-rich repeat protein, partial [Muribaculaceae bacterium]|nr:leucine-rich repeat protein [Muribaculaceae bacterium]